MITVELYGAEDLQRTLSDAGRKVFPNANARALNKALSTIRTRTVRSIAKTMGVKQKSVRSRIKVSKAARNRQVAVIKYTGRPFNLIHFKARQTKKGVTASPWANRRLYRHAFIATINGTRVVMVRKRRGGGRVGRLPIQSWVGPSVPKIAAEHEIAAERQDVMRTVYPQELRRQLELLMKKAGARVAAGPSSGRRSRGASGAKNR